MYMVEDNILFIMNEGSPAGFQLVHQNTNLDKADSLFINMETFRKFQDLFGSHLVKCLHLHNHLLVQNARMQGKDGGTQ